MSYSFDRGTHSVYSLRYHLILVVKYRRKVFLDDKIIDELKTRKISEGFGIEVISQETDKDHTHILFKATPKTDLVKYINSLKGGTSNAIRHRFPEIKKKLYGNAFWSSSYCLITTGEVTLDQLKKYVESQGEK
jgi:Transposase and inactivated derivatives